MPDSLESNAPELTVAELSGALKRTIEDRFGYVRVRGEISNYRGPHSSGHAYFCLKDSQARIDAVIWKTTFARLKTKPQEGLEVVATGKVTTFPGKSTYQIIIDSIEPAGIGALMALLEERRRKLAAEGLFDEARKQLLPFLPSRIAVVTSPTGAVIRDILHRIADRFPRHVLVWPVRVQGETSAPEVAAAIEGLNGLPETGPLQRPDLIIIARGGGSLEDLWGFNEEAVVRAAAASLIPVISAIGHETDWTLLDHVADLRAPTPTGAAEKAVPVRAELAAALADLGRRHWGSVRRLAERRRSELRALARALPQAEALVALPRQQLDRAGSRLQNAMAKARDRDRIALSRFAHRLAQQSPQAKMARASQRLEALGDRLTRGLVTASERRRQGFAHLTGRLALALVARTRLERERTGARHSRLENFEQRLRRALHGRLETRWQRLATLSQLLGTLGYHQVLARGFALVRDARGRPLRQVGDVQPGTALDLEFADGRVGAVAAGAPRVRRASAEPPRKKAEQGSLF